MGDSALARIRERRSRERGTTLVELLAVMVIMGIVTSMILLSWFALQNAYSSTTIATKQREMAQQAMARMVQEIRDTSGTVGSVPGRGFVTAGVNQISCYSAFNAPSASQITTDGTGDGVDSEGVGYRPPIGGFYYIWDASTQEGTLYRWRDTDGVTGGNTDGVEGKSAGDRVDVLVPHVVNGRDGTPVFTYTCVNNGTPYRALGDVDTADLATIISVQITLRVDLNPGHAPAYMDLISTAQPRNNRQM